VGLTAEDLALLSTPGALPLATADGMVENVIGTFELPLGVAANFRINDRDVLIPMAVEEPSVVAAASYMARLARECGGFQTSTSGPVMRAQVQVLGATDPHGARHALLRARQQILDTANVRDKLLVSLGGGCKDIDVHVFDDTPRGPMLVMHLIVDVRDAMGANTVNTMAEAVSPLVEQITGGRVCLRILSNLADLRLARARVRVTPEVLSTSEYKGEEVIEGILDAYTLAVVDPYRAATHNKGIMNGIDPVIVATGNDWRAIEAGATRGLAARAVTPHSRIGKRQFGRLGWHLGNADGCGLGGGRHAHASAGTCSAENFECAIGARVGRSGGHRGLGTKHGGLARAVNGRHPTWTHGVAWPKLGGDRRGCWRRGRHHCPPHGARARCSNRPRARALAGNSPRCRQG